MFVFKCSFMYVVHRSYVGNLYDCVLLEYYIKGFAGDPNITDLV